MFRHQMIKKITKCWKCWKSGNKRTVYTHVDTPVDTHGCVRTTITIQFDLGWSNRTWNLD